MTRSEFYAEKYAALERFAADFRRRSGESRYVAGALPELPFDGQAFDLMLSANFLMVYAPLAAGGRAHVVPGLARGGARRPRSEAFD